MNPSLVTSPREFDLLAAAPFNFLGEFVVLGPGGLELTLQRADLGLFGLKLLGKAIPAVHCHLSLLTDTLELPAHRVELHTHLLILEHTRRDDKLCDIVITYRHRHPNSNENPL